MMYNNEGSETHDLIFEIYIESKNGKLVYFLFKILSLKCGKTKRRNFFLNIFFSNSSVGHPKYGYNIYIHVTEVKHFFPSSIICMYICVYLYHNL